MSIACVLKLTSWKNSKKDNCENTASQSACRRGPGLLATQRTTHSLVRNATRRVKMWSLVTVVACVAGTVGALVEVHGKPGRGPAYSLDNVPYRVVGKLDKVVEELNDVVEELGEIVGNFDVPGFGPNGDQSLTDYLTEEWVNRDPDEDLNATQIIARWDYPVETHVVKTEDGYLLEIQRIPHGKNYRARGGKKGAVYLQHGLFSSSFDFVNNLPNESLAFILADHGYDVWLGNIRGNTYARRHVRLHPSDVRFWAFTFDEFIAYDVPSIIDYILEKTGEESLYYVGHSQGTTVMFGLLATRPEYRPKIRAYAALAPVANVTHITTPIRWLAPFSSSFQWVANWLGWGEILSNSKVIKFLARTLCAESVSRELCEAAIFITNGRDPSQLNKTRIPVYVSHSPAGTSVRNVIHFGQEVMSKRFRMFDFGYRGNMRKYGQASPPEYDTHKIRDVPIAFFVSKNDWFADPLDVNYVKGTLRTLEKIYVVPDPDFTHLDFLLGIKAADILYPAVLDFFAKH